MTISLISQATLPNDAIQQCLNVRRLVDITTRQKITTKAPGVLSFKFHKIAAEELPLNNVVGNMNEIIAALKNQIENCEKSARELQTLILAERKFERQEWCLNTNKKMLKFALAAHGDFRKYVSNIKNEFDWYKSDGWPENHAGYKKGDFQFTGYYVTAPMEARKKPNRAFLYPIYSNPGAIKVNIASPLCGVDPVSKIGRGYCLKNANNTYSIIPDREEIDHGALDPKYIIGYVKNPNDLAFLMLQGSGAINLDGKLLHLNYAGANGRPRTMLGRIVQCAQDPTCGGNLDTMKACAKNPKCKDEAKLRCNLTAKVRQSGASEKLVRQYLDSLPQDQARNLRNRDQSFIFYAIEETGPFGSEKIAITPDVSCATDHNVLPVGINFIYNFQKNTSWCIAQDSGGAITGAHVDIYKGEGEQAGIEARKINHAGSLFVALPKS